MLNTKWWRALSLATALISGVLLLGILEGVFDIGIDTNLFQTGMTPGIIFGIAQIILAWAIWKNKI